MNKPLVFAIDAQAHQTALLQANLLAKRLSSKKLNIKVVDLLINQKTILAFKTDLNNLTKLINQQISTQLNIVAELGKIDPKKEALVIVGLNQVLFFDEIANLQPQSVRNSLYVWYDNLLQSSLKELRPDLSILINITPDSSAIINEICSLMPDYFVLADGQNQSVPNLNNRLLGLIQNHLSVSQARQEQKNKTYQHALRLIMQNQNQAKAYGSSLYQDLKPIIKLKINKLLRANLAYGQISTEKLTTNIDLLNYSPKNELSVIKNYAELDYKTKTRRLKTRLKNNPRGIDVNYLVELSGQFKVIYKTMVNLAPKKIESILLDYAFNQQPSDDQYLGRHLKILISTKSVLDENDFINLLPIGSQCSAVLHLNYQDLVELIDILDKQPDFKEILAEFRAELSLAHPLLWAQ